MSSSKTYNKSEIYFEHDFLQVLKNYKKRLIHLNTYNENHSKISQKVVIFININFKKLYFQSKYYIITTFILLPIIQYCGFIKQNRCKKAKIISTRLIYNVIHLLASSANVRTICKNGDFAFTKPPLLTGEIFPKPLTKIGENLNFSPSRATKTGCLFKT